MVNDQERGHSEESWLQLLIEINLDIPMKIRYRLNCVEHAVLIASKV